MYFKSIEDHDNANLITEMYEDDSIPASIVPKPYSDIPPLRDNAIVGRCTSIRIAPDPALDLTPVKPNKIHLKSNRAHTTNTCKNVRFADRAAPPTFSKHLCPNVTKYNITELKQRTFQKTKDKSQVVTVSPWFTSPSKPTEWAVQDCTSGKKTQRTTADIKAKHSKIRRPTISGALSRKKCAESKPVKIKKLSTQLGEESDVQATRYQKPEFNSCLKLAQEMKKLKLNKQEIDKKITEELKAEAIRQALAEKASVQVNVAFEEQQFTGLIPIAVSPSDLLPKLQRQKERKMKACKPPPRQRDPEPDLMEFFPDSIFHECETFHIELPNLTAVAPRRADEGWAFRQYRLHIERSEPL